MGIPVHRDPATPLKPRCIACSNCVLACPFGVPKMMVQLEQMMKCDMCYERTAAGKKPRSRWRP